MTLDRKFACMTDQHKPQRQATIDKHRAVYEYVNTLFNQERLRYDDCIEKAAKRFFYSKGTVENICYFARREEQLNP